MLGGQLEKWVPGQREEVWADFFQVGVLEGLSFGQNDGWSVGRAQGLRLYTGS